MRKPILLGVEGESRNIVEYFNAGVAFDPENKESFMKALSEVRYGFEDYKTGCSNLADEFKRAKIAQTMINTIEKKVK